MNSHFNAKEFEILIKSLKESNPEMSETELIELASLVHNIQEIPEVDAPKGLFEKVNSEINNQASVEDFSPEIREDDTTFERSWLDHFVSSLQSYLLPFSSGAVASAKNIGFVDQGNKNSLAISLNGQVLASGGPGFGTSADNTGTGVIWVYNRDGFDWVETDLITSKALDGQIFLGKSTATNKDGSIIAGGAPDYASVPGAPANNGAVLVFEKQADDKYKETTPAVGTDPAIIPVPPTIPGVNLDPDNQLRIGDELMKGMRLLDRYPFILFVFKFISTQNPILNIILIYLTYICVRSIKYMLNISFLLICFRQMFRHYNYYIKIITFKLFQFKIFSN